MMKNKEIQEERMRNYFIQATKEILKGEGLKCVSVRNIAERAGYSYATLYNYFNDSKELIYECVKDFQEECEESVKFDTANITPGEKRIKLICKSYAKYFVQYTGIFELFFLEKIYDLASKQPTAELIRTFIDRLCEEDWKLLISKKVITKKHAEHLKDQLRLTITGLLLFYINQRYPQSYDDFNKLLDEQLKLILNFK
jgi:AcrR family transcriptional regulator